MRTSCMKLLAMVLGVMICAPAWGQLTLSHVGGGATGSVTENGPGSYTFVGGGDDIWSASDSFDFYHAPLSGDFDYRVRVESLEPVARWSKAGLMIRSSLDGNSPMGFSRVTPAQVATGSGGDGAGDVCFAFRTGTSAPALGENEVGCAAAPSFYPNNWVRLTRSGNAVSAYRSTDGLNWTLMGTQDTALWELGAIPAEAQVGLAVSRHSGADTLATAEFRDLANVAAEDVKITSQPQSASAFTGNTASFHVGVGGGYDHVSLQWRRDGGVIPGATGPTLTVGPVSDGDNGAEFSVVVTSLLNGSSATSVDAVLTVPSAPRVLRTTSAGNPNGVCIFYSEVVDAATGLDTGNYQIGNETVGELTLTGARFLESDPTVVLVDVQETLELGVTYEVIVTDVEDGDGNVVDPNPSFGSFEHGADVRRTFNFSEAGVVPEGTILSGSAASIGDGVLKLTPAANDSWGVFQILNLNSGAQVVQLAAEWKHNMWGSVCCGNGLQPADGYSMNIISSPPVPGYGTPAEEGYGALAQLTVAFDTWDNGGEAPAIDLFVRGALVERVMRQPSGSPVGATAADFRQVTFKLDSDGKVTLTLDGETIFDAVQTTYSPVANAQMVFGARTGGANDNHWIDDIALQDFENLGPVVVTEQPVGGTFDENEVVTLRIKVDGTPPYEIQWTRDGEDIAGATNPSYQFTAVPSLHDGAVFQAQVKNKFSSTESQAVTVNVTPDTTAPELVSAAADGFTTVVVTYSEAVAPGSGDDPFRYRLDGGNSNPQTGVRIFSAVLSAPNEARLTTEQLEEDTLYTLTVNAVVDTSEAQNEILPDSQASFRSPFKTRGYIQRWYLGVSGLPNLNGGAPNLGLAGGINEAEAARNNPDLVRLTCFSDRGEFNNVDEAENYAMWMKGFYRADVSGDHVFYFSSDDPGRLYLSTDENPANARVIAFEPVWNGRRDWVGTARRNAADPENISDPIPLEAGKYYYLEMIGKEGGGGDNMGATVRKPGQPVPAAGTAGIPRINLATIAEGDFNSQAAITQQPQSQMVVQFQSASLSFAFSAQSAACAQFSSAVFGPFVQWQQDTGDGFVDIPGANGTSISTGPLNEGGEYRYRAEVYVPGAKAVSDVAVITVVPDEFAPVIVGTSSADPMQIGIQYDGPLLNDLVNNGALDPFTHTVMNNGNVIEVAAVTLQPDGSGTALRLSSPVSGDFTVTVQQVVDRAGNLAEELTASGARWLDGVADVGGPTPPTEHFSAAPGSIEIRAGGADIWGTADQGGFAHKQVAGNFDVAVRVDRLDFVGNPWAKAGINVRTSLDPGASTLGWIYPTPIAGANGGEYARRRGDGAGIVDVGPTRPAINQLPFWVRLRRVGAGVTGFWSRDGQNWTVQGVANQQETGYPRQMFLTLAVTSHMQGTHTTARFNEFENVVLYPDAQITLSGPNNTQVNLNNIWNLTVNATVVGAPASELWYEWESSPDGALWTPIHNFSGPTLTGQATALGQTSYRVRVSAGGANPVLSQVAVLTVVDDQDPGFLVAAKGNGTFDQVVGTWNEAMHPDGGYLDALAYEVENKATGQLLPILSARIFGSQGREVALQLSPLLPLEPDTTYILRSQPGVVDLSGNESDVTEVEFNSFTVSCGFVRREFYMDIGGVLVGDMTNNPAYPGSPTMSNYHPLLEGVVDQFDNYGIRISGYLRPVESGNYNFYMSADDQGDFYLSTDSSPANLALVAAEPVWNGTRDWTGTARRNAAAPENRSTTLYPGGIPLVAGERYYFESRMKEGGGGDNLAVAVTKTGQAPPPNGSSPITGAFNLAVAADPEGASVTVTQQPQDVVVAQGCGAAGTTVLDADFAQNNGGFTVVNVGAPEGPWTYGAGSWSANGSANRGVASTSALISPTINVPETGNVSVSFRHRYSFEWDGGTRWDGGQVRVSRNGGPFELVPAEAFSANGYAPGLIGGNTTFTGQPGFNGVSHTYAQDGAGTIQGVFDTSVLSLGSVNAGTTLQIQLLGGWDEFSRGALPNWDVTNMRVVAGITGAGQSPKFVADFEAGLPANTALYGSARIDAGILKITDAANSQNGSYVIGDFANGEAVSGFNATFQVRMADSGCCGGPRPADGFSFNFANDLPNGTFTPDVGCCGAEDGDGSGLRISFDAWDNNVGNDTDAPAIEVFYANQSKAIVSLDGVREGARAPATAIPIDPATGQPMHMWTDGEGPTGNGFVNVQVKLDVDGTLDVWFKDVPVLQNVVTGFVPTPGRFGFGGRTGGANQTHWIDNLSIELAGDATPVSFSVAATGAIPGNANHPVFIQWRKDGQPIIGANGTTLTTAVTPLDAGVDFDAQIYVPGAIATSDPATVRYTPAPSVEITSPANGSVVSACATATIVANAFDTDGSVQCVEFFVEGLGSIGRDCDGADGWSVTIQPVVGVFILTAVATGNLGELCESDPVMVSVVNVPPTCQPATASVNQGGSATLQLQGDAGGGAVTYAIVAPPLHGILVLQAQTGAATYTPNSGYCGPDSFDFIVLDTCGNPSAPCTVAINVINMPDAPVCAGGSATTCEDQAVAITLNVTDADLGGCDPESLSAAVVSGPAHGTVSISGLVATYTPAADYSGPDSFTFQATDASGLTSGACTVSITVSPGNDSPTAVIEVSPQLDLGANVSGIHVLSPDNVGACVTLDGTQSWDQDGDAITSYLWLVNGVAVGSGAVLSDVCLPVGDVDVTLIVNDGNGAGGGCDEPGEGSGTVVVSVITAGEAAEALVLVVNDSDIERKNKQPFLATLKNAAAAFDRGSTGAGLNMMEAFINKVGAQLKADPEDQAEWIRLAQQIIDAVSHPNTCEGCGE